MTNEILHCRLCKLISMNYALSELLVWNAYCKLQSFDKLLHLIESNKLEQIEDMVNGES